MSASEDHWLTKIESLKPGDVCEFRFYARTSWHKAQVLHNGGAGFWDVSLTESFSDEVNGEPQRAGEHVLGLYIEQIRLPSQTEAWPAFSNNLCRARVEQQG